MNRKSFLRTLAIGSAVFTGASLIPIKAKAAYKIDSCIACGACAEVCPVDAITYDENDEAVIDEDKCTQCGACVISGICPVDGIICD